MRAHGNMQMTLKGNKLLAVFLILVQEGARVCEEQECLAFILATVASVRPWDCCNTIKVETSIVV